MAGLSGEAILCFSGVSQAISADGFLAEAGIPARVMPNPVAGCGFCLRVAREDLERALALLDERGLPAKLSRQDGGETGGTNAS